MKKLRDNKITASRLLAAVPAHNCGNFIISVSQAAAHWLQYKVKTKYRIFGFIKPIELVLIGYRCVNGRNINSTLLPKIRFVFLCGGIAANEWCFI